MSNKAKELNKKLAYKLNTYTNNEFDQTKIVNNWQWTTWEVELTGYGLEEYYPTLNWENTLDDTKVYEFSITPKKQSHMSGLYFIPLANNYIIFFQSVKGNFAKYEVLTDIEYCYKKINKYFLKRIK